MMFHALYLFLLLYIIPLTPTAAVGPPAYTATDLILLSCGTSTNSNDTSGRSWVGDEHSAYASSNAADVSSACTASYMDPSVFPVPYKTVRVFHSPFTYTFPVCPGQKFLRLYFYLNVKVYSSFFDFSQYLFSVTANGFTLLSNFSALLCFKNTSQPAFMKEFVISVAPDQQLNLTFSPNFNSYAFVNGIEIVSIPDTLYFQGTLSKFGDGLFGLRSDTALENVYRLNVGGGRVEIQDDSGMFRVWSPDDDYIQCSGDFGYTPHLEDVQIKYSDGTPPYSAPAIVYTTARVMGNTSVSLEWIFPVDSGFHYLLRLHFCEFTLDVRAQNQRVFTVNINNQPKVLDADVIYWAGGPDIPIFRDYATWVPDDGHHGMQGLRLSLYPYRETSPKYNSALLNGLEIFKLSDPERSLAATNRRILSVNSSPPAVPWNKSETAGSYANYAIIGGVLIQVVGGVGLLILCLWRSVKGSDATSAPKTLSVRFSTSSSSTTRPCGSVSLPSDLCRYFTIDEIKSATRNFDKNLIVGKGGFGNVYKGVVDRGATTVAIKRLHPSSNQGAREFLTEIQMLSKLRHLHLVSLIGYCNDDEEMILVYDYMAHGTLRDHLYNTDNPPLAWKQRLQICMGAATGLHYLHTGSEHAIIHRDVKSTNILLDENWVAKIADFGLSKMGHANDSFTHISTNVKGTFGYLDPKYFSSHQLTRKSDVYAFGVVLFEVLSGRAAVDIRLDEEQHSLAEWARYCIREGEVDRLIDPNLMGQISAACFKVFVGIAGRCIHIQPLERPTMADVVMGLELALALQQTTDSAEEDDDAGIIYSDGSDVFISMDDITAPKEKSDKFTGEDRPSSRTRKSQSGTFRYISSGEIICV